MRYSQRELDELRERLKWDLPLWSRNCATIITKQKKRVRAELKPEQLRLWLALQEQARAGKPMRVLILKARQIGFSTLIQLLIMMRVTQRANHEALSIAQDIKTARRLFRMADTIWKNLPTDPELRLKPQLASRNVGRTLHFGEPSRHAQELGHVGLDSYYEVDTAKEYEAARGGTLADFHGSEVAFWPDIDRKLSAALEAVPDEPDTFIGLESTANGFNDFSDLWEDAEDGRNEYIPFFSPWFKEDTYSRPFANDAEREDFIATIGQDAIGEKEPQYIEMFDLSYEQLHWRRWKINTPQMGGDLRKWEQEYPATAEEAFISTGRKVFNPLFVQRVVHHAETTDPRRPTDTEGPRLGVLNEPKGRYRRKGRHGVVDVPAGVEWVTREATGFARNHPFWRVWEPPEDNGAYMVVVDPAEGAETEEGGETDYSAIHVGDWRTGEQAAVHRSRLDPDLVAVQAFLAHLYWNRAMVVVEKNGYGMSIARRLYLDFGVPRHRFYLRKSPDDQRARESDRLGWSTDRTTKPLLVANGIETLRDMVENGPLDLVRSRILADEFTTYMQDERGRTSAQKGRHDDELMAWLIFHQVRSEVPPPPECKAGQVLSTMTRKIRDPAMGW